MKREVLQKGNQLLRTKCKKIHEQTEINRIVQDLKDTIAYLKTTYDFSRGIGLAAPQIGELYRIAVIESGGREYVLINPEIIEKSDEKHDVWEGCISFFEYRAFVPRHKQIVVRAFDAEQNEYLIKAQSDFAASLQHEIDHLDGILYVDRLPNSEDDLVISDKV